MVGFPLQIFSPNWLNSKWRAQSMKSVQLTPHLTMCLIGLSYVASSSVIAPILSIYLKDGVNATVEMIGLITAVFFVASASAKLLLGVFAGGKKTITFLMIAFVVYSVCPMLYPLTINVTVLLALRAIQGFAYALIGTASLILAALTIPTVERDKGVGKYTAFLSMGFLVGPIITTFSIPFFGVANTFYFAGIVGFIGVFASSFLYRKLSVIEENWQIVGVTMDKESLGNRISAVVRNKMFVMSLVGNFAFFLLFGLLLTYSPLYAKENFHLSNELISALFVLYYIATTITRFSVGRITASKKISKQALVAVSTIFAALFSFFIAITGNNMVFACFFALIGAVQGVIFPVGSMLIAEHVQASRNVLANSLYLMAIDTSQGIAPLITAGIVAQYGYGYSFIVSAAISAVAALLLMLLNASRKVNM